VIFPTKRVLRAGTSGVIARERILLGGVASLVMTFEIGWAAIHSLFSVTCVRVLARELTLFITSREV